MKRSVGIFVTAVCILGLSSACSKSREGFAGEIDALFHGAIREVNALTSKAGRAENLDALSDYQAEVEQVKMRTLVTLNDLGDKYSEEEQEAAQYDLADVYAEFREATENFVEASMKAYNRLAVAEQDDEE